VTATCLRLALFALVAAFSVRVHAQDLEPRAYGNAPVGLNFLIVGYAHAEGGLVTDPSIPLENPHLEVPGAFVGYARTLGLWNRSAKVAVALPYAWLSGSADLNGVPQSRVVDGFADPRVGFTINLYGAPALSLKEFASYHQNVIIGASVAVSAPFGQYDGDRLVNIGSNRWSLKSEIGTSWAVRRWILELDVGATIYQDNDDFFGGQKREQDPVYAAQGHVIYSFKSGVWAALDSTYYTGGQAELDGVESGSELKNSRAGLTLVFPINRRNSLKLYASSGISVRTGTDFDIGGIAWQYRWGGGI